ncbi:Parvalbumin alpha [Folsomia candida]|uniref:Parvalbumin alpha n=1 Tax=Folsomia candida TaxID=158441 RepID=A0A226CXB5_FOLCA|nr:Parvalbumin alpha [Folsomia candida]
MDKTHKYTWAEVEEAFKKMETYNPTDQSIKVADFEKMLVGTLRYISTPEQVATYANMWAGPFEGKIRLDIFAPIMGAVADDVELLRIFVHALDRNKDGFVDNEEFATIVEVLLIHNKDFPRVDYKTFAVEADTNKDGKISIDEAIAWFAKKGRKQA